MIVRSGELLTVGECYCTWVCCAHSSLSEPSSLTLISLWVLQSHPTRHMLSAVRSDHAQNRPLSDRGVVMGWSAMKLSLTAPM